MRQSVAIARALLHGFTGAGLFRRLTYPGAPKEFFDSRPLIEQGLAYSPLSCVRDGERRAAITRIVEQEIGQESDAKESDSHDDIFR